MRKIATALAVVGLCMSQQAVAREDTWLYTYIMCQDKTKFAKHYFRISNNNKNFSIFNEYRGWEVECAFPIDSINTTKTEENEENVIDRNKNGMEWVKYNETCIIEKSHIYYNFNSWYEKDNENLYKIIISINRINGFYRFSDNSIVITELNKIIDSMSGTNKNINNTDYANNDEGICTKIGAEKIPHIKQSKF